VVSSSIQPAIAIVGVDSVVVLCAASSSQPSPSQTRCRANQGKSILLSFFSFLLFLSCCLSRPRPRPRIPRLVSRPLRTRSRLPRTHRATHRVAQTLLVARPLLLFNGIVSWVSVLALALAHLRAPQPGHAVLASPGLVLGSSIIRWRRAANRDTTHPSKLTCMSTHALLHLAQPQVHQLNYSTTRRRYCALPSGPDPTPLPPLPPGLTLSSVMYSAQSTGAEVATINPAALSSGDIANAFSRGIKRSRSPWTYDTPRLPGDAHGMLWQILCSLTLCGDALLYTPGSGNTLALHHILVEPCTAEIRTGTTALGLGRCAM
jgi:hypothetical protein